INPKEIIENSCSHPESRLDTISTAGPENLCYILFSSGSTGVPKGICVTRRNFAHFLQNFLNNYSINCNDRISQTFGLSFDPALSDIFLAFTNGASLYPLLDEEIYNISNFICENKLTYWSSVPTLARLNTKRQKSFIKSKMNSLRYTTFTGEALEGELCKIWRESAPFCQIENLYGPTETTINICRHILKELSPEQGPIPIGQVYPDHRIALIDSELKQISAINTPGELIVQGPQVTQGYLNDTEETKAKFFEWNRDGHTWYRTGDLVFLDKNGMFVFKGRKDWQLKIAGMRIEPEEIEYVCAQAAPQTRFLAFGDSKSFPQQILGVIDRNLSDNEFESILKHCHKELPRIFVPKRIFFSPSFPTHPSGKIDRQKIEDLLHQGKLLEIWPPKKPHL
ncbi:MAG: AMP-binding protein, partial [Bdellovibrionales bacterium]|nr:AMP-binding protein [Bdellovibrionales bacterium]